MIQTHRIDSPQEVDGYLATLLNDGVTLPELEVHVIQKFPEAAIRKPTELLPPMRGLQPRLSNCGSLAAGPSLAFLT